MLKHMTAGQFKEAVLSNRIIVRKKSPSRFEAYYITYKDGRFNLRQIVNPDTKDGDFRQTGGNYNKYFATLEKIAAYIDNGTDLLDFVEKNQNYIQMD